MTDDPRDRPLAATAYRPLDPAGRRRTFRVAPIYPALAGLGLTAVLVMAYLFIARAVIFRAEPESAELAVSGLSFNIGDNYLLLPGEHRVTAGAEGYHPFEETVTVTEERTQEIEIRLQPLPGRLEVNSDLQGIEVLIDGQLAGTAPGTIADVSRGSHIVEFRKHRYFPLRQEIEVEGLGRVQAVEVSLEPAWGAMHFSTVPAGAELTVDGEPRGQTPLRTEILETGSRVNVALRGYKTWERDLSVKAGTEATQPPIELEVADGLLRVSSSPPGANVRLDGEFRGTAPLQLPLSPLREHRVELFLEGYHNAVRTASVEPEGEASLNVSLTPIIGHIELTIAPADAEVLVDGGSHGSGSQTLALTAVEHRLAVRKQGYRAQEFRITPRPGQQQSLDVRLLTLNEAYWAERPPMTTSVVGSKLKLFRPSGQFVLGAPRREPGRRANEAQRPVRLERPFYLGTHEVTNEEFRRYRPEHSSSAARGQTLDMDDQPVVNVDWQEAALFCNWLSRREGLPLFYVESNALVTGINPDAHGYRLPTEAEWAWVARIDAQGQEMMFPWGTDLYPPTSVIENYADRSAVDILTFTLSNYDDGFAVSAPVGRFQPNHNGLYDMSGNVSEWISDFYEIRPAQGAPEVDPTGPATGDRHVIRGASWAKASRSELRLSYRDAGSDGKMDTGFRIARYVDRAGGEP